MVQKNEFFEQGRALTEDDWSELELTHGYEKSKLLAEREAWKFVEQLPADEKFDLVTINPSLIVGPSYSISDFASCEIISNLMLNKFPGLPRIKLGVVDVRDVAYAHV